MSLTLFCNKIIDIKFSIIQICLLNLLIHVLTLIQKDKTLKTQCKLKTRLDLTITEHYVGI